MHSASTIGGKNLLRISSSDKLLKKGIWIYFFLLLAEGGLRKWILPGLATPLLVVRDPIAIWLVLSGIKHNLFPGVVYLRIAIFVGIVSIFTALFFGHHSLIVALYGARILLLHFPLLFLIGRVFDREEVVQVGKVVILLSLPVALLTAVQFYSPQSAFINRGVGGDEAGSGFSGALGFFRPSGIFSFTNGNALFFALVAAFVFYFWLNAKEVNRLILISATIGLLAEIPLSISRTLFYSCCVAAAFAFLATLRTPKYLGKFILAFVAIMIALSFLGKSSFFSTATEAFNARFNGATEWEGGVQGTLVNRYLGGMLTPFTDLGERPFLGKGIGASTNIAQTIGIDGQYLVWEEDEWQRIIFELGLVMGLAIIFCRLGLCIKMAIGAYKKLLAGDLLPWILLSFAATTIPMGQWEQPTSLGFSIFVGGLVIASFKNQVTI